VLVLGGGDGLAVREILKYPNVEAVTLVDLDPAMTELFSTAPQWSP
jgi:spermidine synthase